MSSIDPYLRLAIEKKAKKFVLSPEQKPYLEFDNGKTSFGKIVTGQQIQKAVVELVPKELLYKFNTDGEVNWKYQINGHPFNISTKSLPTGIEVIFDNSDIAEALNKANLEEHPNQYNAVSETEENENLQQLKEQNPKTNSFVSQANQKIDYEIDRYLLKVLEYKASDLHMCSGCKPMYRIDGELCEDSMMEELDPQYLVNTLFEISMEDSFDDFQENGSCDFAYELGDIARFRVNIFKEYRGISGSFRIIPNKIPSAEELKLPAVVKMLASLPKGLVLVTGPTGSGKSTTLAAILDLVNRTRNDHIITIESPIEFIHKNRKCLVHQREVGMHTPGSGDALRDALREDPDVVLIGEMRDLETISTAIETAATGHLVLGTLHTTTAINTVDRMIDMFPSDRQGQVRTMLADSLKAVISQILVKKIGGGRCAAQEILFVNTSISNMIRERKTHQIFNIMQTGKEYGMQLINEELTKLVKNNTITPMEAYKKAVDKREIMATFAAAGIRFKPPTDIETLTVMEESKQNEQRKTLTMDAQK